MSFIKLTTDKSVKQLRWVYIGASLFDRCCTLIGQPDSYWHHPESVREGNEFVRYFLSRGLPVYLLYSLIYISAVLLVISIIPRRLALVGLLSMILVHYFAACTWLVYHWHFGVCASSIYGVVLGVVFVFVAFPDPDKPHAKNLLSDDPAAS
jgi:hypothetical protein